MSWTAAFGQVAAVLNLAILAVREIMMGFEIEDTVSIYKIDFGESTPYHGLVVNVAGMTIDEYNKMMHGYLGTVRSKTDEEKAEANIASSDYIRSIFASKVRDWNLTRKGEPVPVSSEEIENLDSRLSVILVRRWMDELTSIPPELVGKLSDGGISQDQLTALANSSVNRSN